MLVDTPVRRSRLEQFMRNLARTGLIRPSRMDAIRQRALRDAEADPARATTKATQEFARALVRRGELTPYQARKILQGATNGFFLGGYRILEPLGKGGSGKVFLAVREPEPTNGTSTEIPDTGHKDSSRDRERPDKVAIKVLPPRRAMRDPHALQRFRREMEISAALDHPNVARTIDVGNEGSVHYMVMEYVPGCSLLDFVKGEGGRGPLPIAEATGLALKVLAGLRAAHAQGLIHRDVKPSNIMITPDGDAKLLDLGLARVTRPTDEDDPTTRETELTAHGRLIGTLDYASPEQLVDAASVDPRSDLYSLGCTLYFALTGSPPFPGGDAINKIYKHRMEQPTPLEQFVPGLPAPFVRIVRRLMAKKPNDRYPDCDALEVDLAPWADPDQDLVALARLDQTMTKARSSSFDDDDESLWRILDDDKGGGTGFGSNILLRGLERAEGEEEIRSVPLTSPEPTDHVAMRTHHVSDGSVDFQPRPVPPLPTGAEPPLEIESNSWLRNFIIAVVVLGLLAILLITLAF